MFKSELTDTILCFECNRPCSLMTMYGAFSPSTLMNYFCCKGCLLEFVEAH